MKTIESGLLLAAGFVLAAPVWAMHPLQTDDTGTVSPSGWQVEVSATRDADDADGVDATGLEAGLAVTHGLTAVMDMGIGLTAAHVDDGTTTESGPGDGKVWLKWRFLEHDGSSLAFVPYLTLPLGDDERGFGTGAVSWGATLVGSTELSSTVSAHVNVGWDHVNYGDSAAEEGIRQDVWRASAAVAFKLDDWTLVAETGAAGSEDPAADAPAFVGAGVVYSATSSTAVSFGARAALNDAETDMAVTAAVTVSW